MLTTPAFLPAASPLPSAALEQVAGEIAADAAVARARGARLLQERSHGEDLDARMLAVLIDAVLESLQQVVRSELN